MKKGLLVALLLTSGFSFSQSSFDFGVRAGFNLLPTAKDEATGRKYYTGFNGGGLIVKHFGDHFGIKAELNYTGKTKEFYYTKTSSLLTDLGPTLSAFAGGGIDISSLAGGLGGINDTVYSHYDGKDKFGFIELPIIFTYRIKQFDIGLGGYFSYMLTAKSVTRLTQNSPLLDLLQPVIDSLGFAATIVNGMIAGTYPGINEPSITESNAKDAFIKADYGFIADLTYHYSSQFFFNLRYQYGIPNYRITPLKKPDNFTSITFSFGYLFNLKNKSGDRFM